MKLDNTYLGFTEKNTPMQKAKIEKILNKQIRSEGVIYSNKEFVLTRLQEDYSLEVEENCTHYSRRLDDYTKPITEYRLERKEKEGYISTYKIEKTLYNFGLYLQENNLLKEENINNYIVLETAKIKAIEKAIKGKKLKEEQEKELQEQKEKEFKMWLESEAINYRDASKIQLAKDIFLGELNQYNEIPTNCLLVLIDQIEDPRCREELKRRLHNGNTTSKKVFFYITGIKLPSNDKGTVEILNTITKEKYTGMLQYKKTLKEGEEIFYKLFVVPKIIFVECYGEYLNNEYGLDLFICKEYGTSYNISSIESGCRIASGNTKEEALKDLKEIIELNGLDIIKNHINDSIERYGTSPRSKAA